MSPESITIELDDKRRNVGVWWQRFQHVVGGAPLLRAGIARVRAPGGHGDVLAWCEIVVATVLLLIFVRDLRAEARAQLAKEEPEVHHAHVGPEWFDVAAGVLLILEAVHTTHPGGKPLYAHALLWLGIVTLITGVAHGVLVNLQSKRRFVQLDATGVRARLSRFRKFDIAWSELRDVQLRDDEITLVTNGGKHDIPLGRYANAGEIRKAFANWRERATLSSAS
jgi:hypothetical protein